MDCRDAIARMSDLLDDELGAGARTALRGHLRGCRPCAAYLEQLRTSIEVAASLRSEEDACLPAALEARALALARSHCRGGSSGARAARVPLGIGDAEIGLGAHLAYFWETGLEFERAMGFLEAGFDAGDRCLVLGHEEANERVDGLLRARAVAVDGLRARRQLTWIGGSPSGDALLAAAAGGVRAALADGAPRVRLLGNLGWGRAGWPGDGEIEAFEARVTGFARELPCVVLCMYDVAALPGRILMRGGLEAHPLTMRRGRLHENPHHLPAERFLAI